MRIAMIAVIAALLVSGCVHTDVKKNIEAINNIQPGDAQQQVLEKLGPPAIEKSIDERRTVVYYRTKSDGGNDAEVTEALCTAVAFEDGKVVSVGDDPTARWQKEAKEANRLAEIAEQKRLEAEKAEAAWRKADGERKAKIAELEKKVRPVPASNAKLNLKLYRELLALDPSNTRYQKKVAHYEARLEAQKTARAEKARIDAEKKEREAWEKARDARNKRLRQYSGNGIAEMAVHDMGGGALYVWIKNVGKQVITTHPDYLTLLDMNGKTVSCQISDSFDSVLEPGSIAHGKIDFEKSVVPGRLVLNLNDGQRIEKSFE